MAELHSGTTDGAPEQTSSMQPNQEDHTLLGFPAEVLDNIFSYSLRLGPDHMVTIKRDQTLALPGQNLVSTSLLNVNKQVSAKAQEIFFRVNWFMVALSCQSCMGGLQASYGHHYSIPTMWNTQLRQRVYQMQHIAIAVVIGDETANHDRIDAMLRVLQPEKVTDMIQDQREENNCIVGAAIDELCNVLEISNRLRHIQIGLFDRGHPALKTGQEHRTLKPFSKLRNLHSVKVINVPENFEQIMQQTMKQKRNRGNEMEYSLTDPTAMQH